QATQVGACAASRIEHPLAGARRERPQSVAAVERDERVRRRIVGLGPTIVSLPYRPPVHTLAHRPFLHPPVYGTWQTEAREGSGVPAPVRALAAPDQPLPVARRAGGMAVRAITASPGRPGHRGGSHAMADEQPTPTHVTPEQFFEQLLPAGFAAQK